MAERAWDVVVVGAGNAAFCAALAAREHGASVLVLERAPRRTRRRQLAASPPAPCASSTDGVDDLRALMPDLTEDEIAHAPISAPTPTSSSSTTWAASPSTAPTPSSSSSWSTQLLETLRGCAHKGVRFAPI